MLGVVELRLQVVHQRLLLFRQGRGAAGERAGLDREPLHDPVEAGARVDAGRGQAQEVAHVLRGLRAEQFDGDRAGAGVEDSAVLRELLGRVGGERAPARAAACRECVTAVIAMRSVGTLSAVVGVSEIFWTTSMPSDTWPNTVYLPSSAG